MDRETVVTLDYFAGLALQALIQAAAQPELDGRGRVIADLPLSFQDLWLHGPDSEPEGTSGLSYAALYSQVAYRLADAMLAERSKRWTGSSSAAPSSTETPEEPEVTAMRHDDEKDLKHDRAVVLEVMEALTLDLSLRGWNYAGTEVGHRSLTRQFIREGRDRIMIVVRPDDGVSEPHG